MQPDVITLAVDVANNAVIVDQPYNRYEEDKNRSSYVSPAHLPDTRDMLTMYRTFPTRNGNFKGTGKSSVKFTQDVSVPGVDSSTTLTSPIILEVSFSVPVGTAVADLKEIRQRAVAILDSDTLMDALNLQLMV